jgi:branched-chain amino acid transport system substrate-binding protein
VVGVVGPATSGEVSMSWAVARDHKTPIISPSATAPNLAQVPADGFKFRNVPSDDVQGVAMAYYLRQRADPPITSAILVYEDTPYGVGLADAFRAAFAAAGGTVTADVTFDQNLADDAAADAVVAEIVATSPSMVVLVSLELDGKRIIHRWHASGDLPGLEWFLTDGSRSAGFLDGLPAVMAGTRGTAPTFPLLGPAYGQLATAYNLRYDDDISEQIYAPNVWDGVHLLAAALAYQSVHGDGTFGGEGLRDALLQISRGPGAIVHAGQWRDMMATIRAGGNIDYDGAAGPNDFDEWGEAIGPYEVWKIVEDGSGGLTFEQELFLEAHEIEALAGGE